MKIKQYKIARRLGARIFRKTENPKLVIGPQKGGAGKKHRRPPSEYGLKLLEKQKMRYTYGLSEGQFSNYVKKATTRREVNPAEYLYQLLESRLDSIVFKLGFARTRRHARQVVSHGKVMVNGRRVTIPSHELRAGDKVEVRKADLDKPLFKALQIENKDFIPPVWLKRKGNEFEGSIQGIPAVGETPEVISNLTSIIEFYSR